MTVTNREERILGIIETARAKRGKFRDERINMAHGAGGKASQSMIEGLFEPAFGAQVTEDAASIEIGGAPLAFTTDSFVVKPLRFPGGSIGDLAVNGTVNDLAVSGARPSALTLSLTLDTEVRPELGVGTRESGWGSQQCDRSRDGKAPGKNRQRDSFGCWLSEDPRSHEALEPPTQTIDQSKLPRLIG